MLKSDKLYYASAALAFLAVAAFVIFAIFVMFYNTWSPGCSFVCTGARDKFEVNLINSIVPTMITAACLVVPYGYLDTKRMRY